MTNEEAIAIITEAIEDYVCNHVTDTAQAQRMLNAVQALEQEPRKDEVILTNKEYRELVSSEYENGYAKGFRDAIEQEPSGDLISRAEAIKAIDEKAKRIKNEDTLNGLAGAVGILFDLPSVNSQPCEDAISRQAVLETLDDMDNVLDEDRTIENYKELLKECYEVLPSVKPQEPKKKYDNRWFNGYAN